MTPLLRDRRWFWWMAASAVAVFLMIAGAGWIREKREVAVMLERSQNYAADLRARVDGVRDGISLADFRASLPEAYENGEAGRWAVSIPNAYDEGLGMPYSSEVVQFLVAEDGGVKADFDSGRAVHKKTIGCFAEPKGPWYYFRRAWQ